MRRPTVAAVLACAALAACTSTAPTFSATPSEGGVETTASPTPTTAPSEAAPPSTEPSEVAPAPLSNDELAAMQVNELGRVLVAEWHEIQDVTGSYKTSLDDFKAQLEDLYERGYRPISAAEMVAGTFPIPAGTSPVLLTFDDSYKEHLHFGPDGVTPDPDSVVGILEAMEARDPTWRARAVFAFYWPVPFRETDPDLIARKLRYLVDHGFELSNHSNTHDNLGELAPDEVVSNLAASQRRLQEVLPGYAPQTLTLPFGMFPDDEDLVVSGTDGDVTYRHELVFLVGWMPTRSPHHVDFDPMRVLRTPAHGPWRRDDPTFADWLDWLDEEPLRRFVSDGDPTVITLPDSYLDVLAPTPLLPTRTYPAP